MKRKYVGFGLIIMLMFLATYWFSSGRLVIAPTLAFKIVDGHTFKLSQFQGQPVLVVFWATTCPSCVKEIPHLIELYQELAPQGLEIIAVSMAYVPPSQVMEMRQHKQIPYPIALDVDGKVAMAFGDVQQTPTTFLINPQGEIEQRITGKLNLAQIRTTLYSMLATGG
jgi:peroxiredoxin